MYYDKSIVLLCKNLQEEEQLLHLYHDRNSLLDQGVRLNIHDKIHLFSSSINIVVCSKQLWHVATVEVLTFSFNTMLAEVDFATNVRLEKYKKNC